MFTEREHFDQQPLAALQERLDRLRINFDRFEDAHNALIEGEINDNTLELHQQLYDDVERTYYTTSAKLIGQIAVIQPREEQRRKPVTDGNGRVPPNQVRDALRQPPPVQDDQPFHGFDIRNVPGLGLPERPVHAEPMDLEHQPIGPVNAQQNVQQSNFIVRLPPDPLAEASASATPCSASSTFRLHQD